jgi:dethiobiotin synthetase
LHAIADYQLECAGWIANVLDADMPALQENIEALRERIPGPLLGVIPYQIQPDAHAVAALLNMELLESKEVDG